jgi:hypothetical protein
MLQKIHLYLNDGFEINQAVWNSSVCYTGNLHSELMQIIQLGAFCFLSSTVTESFSTVLLHGSINIGHFLTKHLQHFFNDLYFTKVMQMNILSSKNIFLTCTNQFL